MIILTLSDGLPEELSVSAEVRMHKKTLVTISTCAAERIRNLLAEGFCLFGGFSCRQATSSRVTKFGLCLFIAVVACFSEGEIAWAPTGGVFGNVEGTTGKVQQGMRWRVGSRRREAM